MTVTYPKTAACACGAMTATAKAPPQFVHACSCLDCQRGTGSAFSYSAFFKASDVTIDGDVKTWRRISTSGRWQDCFFCTTCGVTVAARLEVIADMIGVSAGCFADSEFPAPGKLFWSSRSHHWLELADSIERVETQ
jgi:hypothetical protein